MDPKLLKILVCPICKGPLKFLSSEQVLVCSADGLSYPIRDGIPVLIEEESVPLDVDLRKKIDALRK
ncbi:Trm112 family protein [Candidatus Ichthyocystis hellenicum]|uniref:Trm112 family protein n=1 Tax=Candidatus Ichthyocystis hellenicum TaxID=1561003 RepID=UPI000B877BD9|nr:Trm112 family protein [Candidatus Ichthyocystis hellenicum]